MSSITWVLHISTWMLAPRHSCPPKAGLEIIELLNRGRFVPSENKSQIPGSWISQKALQTPHLWPRVVTEPLPYHNSTSTATGAGREGTPARPLPMDYSRRVQFFQRAALSLGAPLRPRIHKTGSSTIANPEGLGSQGWHIFWQARLKENPKMKEAPSHKTLEESHS